jgi:hypothetical protein
MESDPKRLLEGSTVRACFTIVCRAIFFVPPPIKHSGMTLGVELDRES